MKDLYIYNKDVKLHYVTWENTSKPTLVLLHGLTANAHAFEGLITNGINEHFNIISLDLRGRGLSDKPDTGYSYKDHAIDVIALLDELKIDKAYLVGHSFGGLLAAHIAAYHPERVKKLVILDVAIRLNDKVIEMLATTFSRLEKVYDNYDSFIDEIKAGPQNTFWDSDFERYYKADLEFLPDGHVRPLSKLENIVEASQATQDEDWVKIFPSIQQPTLLCVGVNNYALGEPLLPMAYAEETVSLMPNCKLVKIDGNHHTMLYGKGAKQIVDAIIDFLK